MDDLVDSHVQGQVVLPLDEEVNDWHQLPPLLLPPPESVVLHYVGRAAIGPASHALLPLVKGISVKVDRSARQFGQLVFLHLVLL